MGKIHGKRERIDFSLRDLFQAKLLTLTQSRRDRKENIKKKLKDRSLFPLCALYGSALELILFCSLWFRVRVFCIN